MLELTKKPKGTTIIEGFPGIGLVGTIATGFLVDHLECEKIGKCYFENAPPTLAIHGSYKLDPVSIHHNKKYNVVIIHAITAPTKIEWQAAATVMDICKQLKPKELISIEGVGSRSPEPQIFQFTDDSKTKKDFEKLNIPSLDEGIVMGVTAALMQKQDGTPLTSLFAETTSQMPDSKAAAKIIEALDKYLGLDVDTKPLLKQAENFEDKLKGLMKHAAATKQVKEDKHQLDYLG
jgi:uncharacterized protein|tara:strand:- start:117 stop:821 length:705 start_codon:yes stop_codon:yes gene_type:complete